MEGFLGQAEGVFLEKEANGRFPGERGRVEGFLVKKASGRFPAKGRWKVSWKRQVVSWERRRVEGFLGKEASERFPGKGSMWKVCQGVGL